jgi:hypothetical protein
MAYYDHGYGYPPVRPRVFLRQAQDRLTLRRTVQVRLGSNPAVPRDGCPVAHPSSWSRDANS